MSQTSETERLEDPGGPQVLHAEPAATYGINPATHVPHPHRPRGWPLGAQLTVGVLVVVLAAVLAISMITIKSVNAKANKAELGVTQLSQALGVNASQISQENSATGGSISRLGGSVTSIRGQLSALQAQMGALSVRVSRYGVCLITATNNNGLMVNTQLTTPVGAGGNVSCPQGVLVRVAPARG